MASEARVTSSLTVLKRSGAVTVIDYQSRPAAFTADVSGTKGPTPGSLAVPTTGVDVDLSQLGVYGLCRIMNQDGTNSLKVGLSDGSTFHPMLKLKPGESFVVRLDPDLGQEYTDTGTGTTSVVNQLHLKAEGAAVAALVEVFED